MIRNSAIILIITAILLISCIARDRQADKPLLQNGGFEDGTTRDTLYWTLNGGPYHTEFGEVSPPEGWIAWWHEGPLCTGTPDYRLGRPEVKVISGPDLERIRSGAQAVQWFTFYRCHKGGLLQQVAVEPDHYYTFSVFAHAWYSRCSTEPHKPPLDTDCATPITWAQDWLSVGIDPTGGTDPMASTVKWGQAQEIYGAYVNEPLVTGRIQAQEDKVTVIIKSEASHPLKHDDFYIDDALLLDVTYQAFLPLIRLE